MKKTIKGVTSKAAAFRVVAQIEGSNTTSVFLREASDSAFVLAKRTFLIDGRRLPRGKNTLDIFPELALGPDSPKFQLARDRVTTKETIKPLTRRQALAWAIRELMPRTFHKDLARFLK